MDNAAQAGNLSFQAIVLPYLPRASAASVLHAEISGQHTPRQASWRAGLAVYSPPPSVGDVLSSHRWCLVCVRAHGGPIRGLQCGA